MSILLPDIAFESQQVFLLNRCVMLMMYSDLETSTFSAISPDRELHSDVYDALFDIHEHNKLYSWRHYTCEVVTKEDGPAFFHKIYIYKEYQL